MKRFLFILIVFAAVNSFAQEYKSVHQREDEYYRVNKFSKVNTSTQAVLNKASSNLQLTKTVFGYLPYWMYKTTQSYLRYDLLTHLSIFSFAADSNGGLTEPTGWPWTTIISSARSNSVKLIMCVTNFDGNTIHKLLTNETAKQNFFNNIKSKIAAQSLDGVNIDFENLLDADKSTVINNFMSQLKTFLNAYQSSLEISFASPVAGYGKWNFSGLASACDYLFVMGYDFYGSWSATTGPSAPLISSPQAPTVGSYLSITKSFEEDYKQVGSNKLILGVPYYGNYWKTKTQNAYSKVDSLETKNGYQRPIYYSEIISSYSSKGINWDSNSQTPWICWYDTTYKQIWFDNDSSLALKYDFAKSKNLKGIGIWALGYDNGRTELWDLIGRKFNTTSSAEEDKTLPDEFVLYQNYPNPFNPETMISYKLQTSGYTTLKVYDLIGREVATLVNEYQQAGIHNSQFSTLRVPLPSGVYFYQLRSNNSVLSKKMILLK